MSAIRAMATSVATATAQLGQPVLATAQVSDVGVPRMPVRVPVRSRSGMASPQRGQSNGRSGGKVEANPIRELQYGQDKTSRGIALLWSFRPHPSTSSEARSPVTLVQLLVWTADH